MEAIFSDCTSCSLVDSSCAVRSATRRSRSCWSRPQCVLGLMAGGDVLQGFDRAEQASTEVADGRGGEVEPAPASAHARKVTLGLVGIWNQAGPDHPVLIEALELLFHHAIDDQVREQWTLAVVDWLPVTAGADDLLLGHAGDGLAGLVPVGNLVILIDHHDRHGGQIHDLVEQAEKEALALFSLATHGQVVQEANDDLLVSDLYPCRLQLYLTDLAGG